MTACSVIAAAARRQPHHDHTTSLYYTQRPPQPTTTLAARAASTIVVRIMSHIPAMLCLPRRRQPSWTLEFSACRFIGMKLFMIVHPEQDCFGEKMEWLGRKNVWLRGLFSALSFLWVLLKLHAPKKTKRWLKILRGSSGVHVHYLPYTFFLPPPVTSRRVPLNQYLAKETKVNRARNGSCIMHSLFFFLMESRASQEHTRDDIWHHTPRRKDYLSAGCFVAMCNKQEGKK